MPRKCVGYVRGQYVRSGPKGRWTESDVSLLLSNYVSDGSASIAAAIGKSPFAVEQKARKLGITLIECMWSEADQDYLRKNYERTPMLEICSTLGRTKASVHCRSRLLNLRRPKPKCPIKSSIEYKRKYVNEYASRRFFYMRASKGYCAAKTEDTTLNRASALWVKWKTQKGKCALTSVKLTRDNARIDHIIPRSRGGSDLMENLRWITDDANQLKRNRTDDELLAICRLLIETTGARHEI